MLPKFTIREHTEERTVKTVLMTTTRYSAETDWSTPAPDLGPNVTQVLGVDAQGRLTTAFPTWGHAQASGAGDREV